MTNRIEFNNRHLRFIFVGFLFSFVIREITGSAYDVAEVIFTSSDFTASHFAAATHLILAFFATILSFVYWARNINTDSNPLDSAFSFQFILLLFDVLLVVFYFFIVKSVEQMDADTGQFGPLSAIPESTILFFVYVLYIFWDIFHDIFEVRNGGGNRTSWGMAKAVAVRAGASILCLILAGVIVWTAWYRAIDSSFSVILLNLAEFANLWIFRSLKIVERRFENWLDCRFKQPGRSFGNKRANQVALYGGLLIYFGVLGVVWLCPDL